MTIRFFFCGVAGLENRGWFAIFAPANLPDQITAYLREKLREVMSQPDMQAKLRELGLQDAKRTTASETQVWDESIVKTKEILRRTGLDLN